MGMMRDAIAMLLGLDADGVAILAGSGGAPHGAAQQLLVLSPGSIPTTDFYLRERIAVLPADRARIVNTLLEKPQVPAQRHTFLVIVRHAPRDWAYWIARNRAAFAGVVLLLDDDTPAALRCEALPFPYALKTAWRFARMRGVLKGACSELWFSTRELQQRHAKGATRLCEPVYLPASGAALTCPDEPVYFYHGTAAHRAEIEWLVDVVRSVQAEIAGATFEISGSARVARLFRGIPRVRVLAPMPWPDYFAHTCRHRYDVGLAPCFDSPFNRARSHVKLFDITRAGAVGVYSDRLPYRGVVEAEQTGCLCPDNVDAWAATIVGLLRDAQRRRALHAAALRWCEATREQVFDGLPRFTEARA